MAVENATVSVTTTATLLSSSAATASDGDGHSLLFTPPTAIYVGPSGVTTGTGYLLTAGVEYAMDMRPGDALYGIVASGTVNVPMLRTGV